MFHAQDILRNINQANIQINSINVEHSNIKVEIQEPTFDSVNVKHENLVQFGREDYSDLENTQGKQTLRWTKD